MTAETALMAVLGLPFAGALLVLALNRPPGLRDVVHILFATGAAVSAVMLTAAAGRGEEARIALGEPLPRIQFAFAIDPLGALSAALIAGLGWLQAANTAGFVRTSRQKSPARLMAVISIMNACAIAVALSANILTLFVSYQALVVCAYPLVAFDGEPERRKTARSVLTLLLGSSIALLLPAIVWTQALAGPFEFAPGGVLAGRVSAFSANLMLLLYVGGLALTAVPPMHRWMPLSSAAPFPALASFYAIALIPAAGVSLLKVVAFVFGAALQEARISAYALIAVAGVSMCAAALLALSKQDIRERLAFSCMAQMLAAVVGALLALPVGIFASMLQVMALACAGATLTMAAGAVAAVTGRTSASEYAGLGRVMPWTFAGFALASASMIGMPPFAGAWAKLWLITASAGAGLIWAAVLIGIAAVLTFLHLGPLSANAFAAQAPADAFRRPDGGSFLLVAPVVLGAAATLWLLVLADPIAAYLSPTWAAPP